MKTGRTFSTFGRIDCFLSSNNGNILASGNEPDARFAWEYAIDWTAYHIPAARPWLQAPGLELARNARPIAAHLRREMISEEELKAQLREREVDNIAVVKVATLEGDGRLSVIKQNTT